MNQKQFNMIAFGVTNYEATYMLFHNIAIAFSEAILEDNPDARVKKFRELYS